jgi:hypothetical protein
MRLKMLVVHLKLKSSFVQIVVKFRFKTVHNMGKISYNSNVNSVAIFLNGFVGVILIFVNLATSANVLGIMLVNIRNNNYQNVLVQVLVQLEVIIMETDKKKC